MEVINQCKLINVDKFIYFVTVLNAGYYSGIKAGFLASLSGNLLRVSISCMYVISNPGLVTHWRFSLWELSFIEWGRIYP